jgi:hypothetical protein
VIFCCSPKPEKTSNTALIVNAFIKGYEKPAEIYYLNKRGQWDNYKKIFEENSSVIFAMPLFVECVPGILMEFLESLTAKKDMENKMKMGFILQSGFEEACQLRTCEKYLEKLPSYLGCEYAGTLIKGGMFALAMSSEKSKEKMLRPFYDMGAAYARENRFDKETVTKFAAPERYSKSVCLLIKLLSPISKIAWGFMARKLGVNGKLNARPYDT